MANANIFQQYLQRPKSVTEFSAEMDEADARKSRNALLALSLQDHAEQRRLAAEGRNALQRIYADPANADPVARERAMLANPLTAQQGLAFQKSRLDNANTEAQTKERTATAAKNDFETRRSKADQALKDIAALSSPQEALASLAAHRQAGDIDETKYQAVLATMPQNPADFPKWQVGMLKNILSAKERMELEQKQQEFDQRSRNDLIGPDGKPNRPVIAAKKEIAKSGASSVSVNTGQKGLDNEFKLRGEFKQEPVYKAHQEMQAAYAQIRQALKQASPAGDLAGATKIMKLLDPGSVVRESELGMAMQASGLMDRVTNYASMVITGQKLTPQQRKDFQSLADALMSESTKQFNAKRGEYNKLGSEYGLNADRALGPEAAGPANVVDFNALK